MILFRGIMLYRRNVHVLPSQLVHYSVTCGVLVLSCTFCFVVINHSTGIAWKSVIRFDTASFRFMTILGGMFRGTPSILFADY